MLNVLMETARVLGLAAVSVSIAATVLVWIAVCAAPLAGLLMSIKPWIHRRSKYRRLPFQVVDGQILQP